MDRIDGKSRLFVWTVAGISFGLGTVLSASFAAASDMGQAAAAQVSQASYQEYLEDGLYAHPGNNRGPAGVAHDLARDDIIALFVSLGLTVSVEPFNYAGETWENVVATKMGSLYPDRCFILGAHYDSYNNPGADDDASGVALILEAARILSSYDSEYTIRFVAFDMAEQGLRGSQAYVTAHAGERILGMVSADMVAHDPNTNKSLVFGNPCSNVLKTALGNAVTAYSGGLTCTLREDAVASSDHLSFQNAGVPACRLAENTALNNPFNRLQSDNVDNQDNINYPYAVKMVRAAVGFMVEQAGVSGLTFTFPNGRPALVDPAGGTRVRVEVQAGGMTPQSDTGLLQYDAGGGLITVPMQLVSANVYDAVFPAAPCGTSVSYRFVAETTGGLAMTSPAASAETFRALAATAASVRFSDDFETDLGWIVSSDAVEGCWQRGVPIGFGQRGDPPVDGDGSGACYLTENHAGNSDVDSGTTRLTSPIIDSGPGDVEIRYTLWYTNCREAAPNKDLFVTHVSIDGGVNWVPAETVGPASATGWVERRFRLGQVVTPTSQVRVQFRASDLHEGSIVEAGVDDFAVWSFSCDADCPGGADGDLDGNGTVDGRDVQVFVSAILDGAGPGAICHGDFTGDELLNAADIPGIVNTLLTS